MDKELLAAKLKKIRNLPQYKDKSEAELVEVVLLADDKRNKKQESDTEAELMNVEAQFNNIEEKKMGKMLLKRYMREFSLDNISDKALLKDLIYLEVFQKMRLQTAAEEFQKDNGSVPLSILDAIHKNLDKIRDLKSALGLTKDANSEQNDGYKAFETLLKKAKLWREKNQASRTIKCPYCSKIYPLRIRTEAWEAQKHPFFSDKLFGNLHLVKLFQENKITKEDVALILGVSPDYVNWLVEKWKTLKKC